jgi:alginate O-acetyltransferase complex protein AlgI
MHMDPLLLPLGISFFTFTQIGYLVDVKQGAASKRGAINYALFVTFFPHLIAGPILHHREMMPQFAQRTTYRFCRENFAAGLTVFIIGLFKKTILADPLSQAVIQGFNDPAHLGLVDSWRTVATYSLQLYFDFSGYSDMAIGLARMFNIRFPLNFDSPFKSENIIEFWQRWHMTLTRYLNLYLDNPLALWVTRWRAQRGLATTKNAHRTFSGFVSMSAFPTMVTMGLIGLWHGAGLQFVVFGLLHGVYIMWNNIFRLWWPKPRAPDVPTFRTKLTQIRNILVTYIAVLVGLVLFRARSLTDAGAFLSGMFGFHGFKVGTPIGLAALVWLAALYVVIWGFPNVHQIMGEAAPALGKSRSTSAALFVTWRENWLWAVAIGILLAFSMLGIGGSSEFLYFQF